MNTFKVPATFDYICHALQCPRCGNVTHDPCSIDLQTKVRLKPEMACLKVGDVMELKHDLLEGGYFQFRLWRPGQPLRVIEAWSCPNCGASPLWALIEIIHSVLRKVEATDLAEAALVDINLVTAEIVMLFPSDRNLELFDMPPDVLEKEIVEAASKHWTDT